MQSLQTPLPQRRSFEVKQLSFICMIYDASEGDHCHYSWPSGVLEGREVDEFCEYRLALSFRFCVNSVGPLRPFVFATAYVTNDLSVLSYEWAARLSDRVRSAASAGDQINGEALALDIDMWIGVSREVSLPQGNRRNTTPYKNLCSRLPRSFTTPRTSSMRAVSSTSSLPSVRTFRRLVAGSSSTVTLSISLSAMPRRSTRARNSVSVKQAGRVASSNFEGTVGAVACLRTLIERCACQC